MAYSVVPFSKLNWEQEGIVNAHMFRVHDSGLRYLDEELGSRVEDCLPDSKVLLDERKKPIAFVAVKKMGGTSLNKVWCIAIPDKRKCAAFRNEYYRHPITELVLHMRKLFPGNVFHYECLTRQGKQFVKQLCSENAGVVHDTKSGSVTIPYLDSMKRAIPLSPIPEK